MYARRPRHVLSSARSQPSVARRSRGSRKFCTGGGVNLTPPPVGIGLKGHKTRKSWCFWRGPTRVLSANFGNTRKHIAGPEIEKCGSQAIG